MVTFLWDAPEDAQIAPLSGEASFLYELSFEEVSIKIKLFYVNSSLMQTFSPARFYNYLQLLIWHFLPQSQ